MKKIRSLLILHRINRTNSLYKIRISPFIAGLLCTVLFTTSVFSQDYPKLFELYHNNQMAELASQLNQLATEKLKNPEISFLRTLYIDNGEEAVKIYQDLFESTNGRIKNLAATKLAEYNYARGFYVKADKYFHIAKTYKPVSSIEVKKEVDNKIERKKEKKTENPYMIQVGAFGVEKNATELADFLKAKNYPVKVVNRNISGKNLFCVWVSGKEDLKYTEELAIRIKNKYRLSYRILKP